MTPTVTQRAAFSWFEIYRRAGCESADAFVRAQTDAQAVLRYARRCGDDAARFYAVEVESAKIPLVRSRDFPKIS